MNILTLTCNWIIIIKRRHRYNYMEHLRCWTMYRHDCCLSFINCYLPHTRCGECWSIQSLFYALRLHERRQRQLVEPHYSHAVCVTLTQSSSFPPMSCQWSQQLSSTMRLMHSSATQNNILIDCSTVYNVHCVPFCFYHFLYVVPVWNWLRLGCIKNYNVCYSSYMKSIATEIPQCTTTPCENVISCQVCLNEFTLPLSHFSWHARWGLLMKRYTATQTTF